MEEQKKHVEEQLVLVKRTLSKLESKDFNMYFFTLDTKGNPTAGVANIYEHVKLLNEMGFKAHILHEKNDYKLIGDQEGDGIADWLGEEYAKLSHVSIENQELNIDPSDFIFIPDVFPTLMDQIKSFTCKKVVFSQAHEYIFELLQIGKRWTDYGFSDVMVTSDKQGNYLKSIFPNIQTHTVPVSIPSYFQDSDKPKIPVVSILTRNHGDAAKIAKSFYLQFPMYKWITFKELRGLSREQFASDLSKSCLAVWIDDVSGFGTFPLEAIECNTPVIGKIPNMVPEWMETTDEAGNMSIRQNGVWTNTTLNIPELIATYLKVWLEDSVPSDLINGLNETKGLYTSEKQVTKAKESYGALLNNRISEIKITIESLEKAQKELESTNA